MIPFANISRRLFLQILFSLSILSPLRPTDIFDGSNSSNSHDILPLKLSKFFRKKDSAKRVGLEYLRLVPMEADAHQLTDLICSFNDKQRAKLAQADAGRLREFLLHQQSRDFEQSRTVNVDGWILSETEARLCALAALI